MSIELNATERTILSFIQALDPYGDRFVKIGQIARGEPVKGKKVDPVFVPVVDIPCLQMTAKTFRKALATLEHLGYVTRDPERSPGIWLKNLHGSRCKSVPIPPRERKTVSDTEEKLDSLGKNLDSLSRKPDSSSRKMISALMPETLAEQEQNFPSRSLQEVLKKPSKASWNLEDLAAAAPPTLEGSSSAAGIVEQCIALSYYPTEQQRQQLAMMSDRQLIAVIERFAKYRQESRAYSSRTPGEQFDFALKLAMHIK